MIFAFWQKSAPIILIHHRFIVISQRYNSIFGGPPGGWASRGVPVTNGMSDGVPSLGRCTLPRQRNIREADISHLPKANISHAKGVYHIAIRRYITVPTAPARPYTVIAILSEYSFVVTAAEMNCP